MNQANRFRTAGASRERRLPWPSLTNKTDPDESACKDCEGCRLRHGRRGVVSVYSEDRGGAGAISCSRDLVGEGYYIGYGGQLSVGTGKTVAYSNVLDRSRATRNTES